MKKRIGALVCAMLAVIMLLSSCGEITETFYSDTNQMAKGSYVLFRTTDMGKYLEFLEEFDEEKFEIVDISTSMDVPKHSYGSSEFYIVTYKRKRIEE